ncbi:MAG TPA: DUF4172 domain-containing protein, partial [Myxococcota bacterium]|nr:DUF4172 domain-containing protein [Myxococcota bacterium]
MQRGDGATYIWQLERWPQWAWDAAKLTRALAAAARAQGRLLGRMQGLGFTPQAHTALHAVTDDVVSSSAIEGERLDLQQVRSSVARRLGLETEALLPADRDIEGVVQMTLDATQNAESPLTMERLGRWHSWLFTSAAEAEVRIGCYRDDRVGPMQVISGPAGRQRVHFEAPPAAQVASEMEQFFQWFNDSDGIDGLLRAGLA